MAKASTNDVIDVVDAIFKKDEHDLSINIKLSKDIAELYLEFGKKISPLLHTNLSPIS
jgi:hypothetical protein